MRDRLLSAVAVGLVLACPAQAQLAPPSSGGIVGFDRALGRLAENRRVLVIGAHPDDEDSDFLAYSARGAGARTGYLSLTRGEGGQNLIGQELGVSLGLLRTGELVAARAIDGAEQFFSRAYDFGYTRSLDETFSFWHPDSLLKDVVRVVRRFKPDILVAVFSGTPRDGHGQHQASAVVARRAFAAAGDGTRFPELLAEEGLRPWQPSAFHMATRSRVDGATIVLPSGSTDPVTGRSYHQIAMDGRSQHRSQDMGRMQPAGPRFTGLLLLDSVAGFDRDQGAGMFMGVAPRRDWLASLADSLRRSVGATGISATVPRLATALRRAAGDRDIDDYRRSLLGDAFLAAAKIVLDATAGGDDLVPGDSTAVVVTVYNDGEYPAAVGGVDIEAPAGWVVTRTSIDENVLGPGEAMAVQFRVTVPPSASPTEPYFLAANRIGYLYDWSGVSPNVRGEPRQPPALRAVAAIEILGAGIEAAREVSHRYNDQAIGEIRREVSVVPRLGVSIGPGMLIWPLDSEGNPRFAVTVVANDSATVAGYVELRSGGARLTAARRFELSGAGDNRSWEVEVDAPGQPGDFQIEAVAVADDGSEYTTGLRAVEYDHIRPSRVVVPARAVLRGADLRLPGVGRIGYVRGAADRVPEALSDIGLAVEVLSDEQIEQGDFGDFDVIVVGSRAYETNRALVASNSRFLEFAENGGRLLVQYQQYQFVRGGFAPFPLSIARPHDRITDENAPVEILEPGHQVFRYPNPIGESDWDGWPQERGLYFAHEWADEYRPLLRMADPDGPPLDGGLLVAPYGEGTYVYTGISFFRALPAGVTGAFRLFLNLLGLDASATP